MEYWKLTIYKKQCLVYTSSSEIGIKALFGASNRIGAVAERNNWAIFHNVSLRLGVWGSVTFTSLMRQQRSSETSALSGPVFFRSRMTFRNLKMIGSVRFSANAFR
ncbi:hypothetical protein EVAR_66140_1 [Eumeta japonica]|uniref:Uncharacterized protein n=1 Tax=Eumeta variegata TaxID=151549 RepID=A0A4C1Z166_EUMVA|nr:hypothetical protein EVAR_66140_1 [Eumeta japonica]